MTTPIDVVTERLGALARRDEPLGAKTTYRVGGAAALYVEARRAADLRAVAAAVRGSDLSVLVLGRGSNLLVADQGFHGVVVALAGDFAVIDDPIETPQGVTVRAGGGVALPVLARRLAEQGIRGFEWAVGVPGSVGGAVRMNAGGHGADVATSLVHAELFDLATATSSEREVGALELSYRHSNVGATEVVTAATFALRRGDADEARRMIADVVRWRREHQPGGLNAGSVFTNPPGDHAGRLVEAAGAKGLRVGSAAVSEKHANFIQSDAGGRADDVVALIDEVARRVKEQSGVTLRTEVVLVGFGAPGFGAPR
jgi:UDP-N-acetylmuramate dehydrogenase